MNEVIDERDRLARLTKKGIGMPVAGLVYWLAVAAMMRILPERTALLASFFATGAVFPLGTLFTRLWGGNLFAKSALLTPLGMQLAAVQIFYWPVIIVVFRQAPSWTLFVLAVLFSSHFLPYAWFYRSAGYALLSILTVLVLCASAIALRGPIPEWVPLLTAACYFVCVVVLHREVVREEAAIGR